MHLFLQTDFLIRYMIITESISIKIIHFTLRITLINNLGGIYLFVRDML